MLTLQHYDFDLQYILDKEVVVPDILSRAYLNECESESTTEDMEVHAYFIEEELPIRDNKLFQYRQATATEKNIAIPNKIHPG